VGKRSPDTGRRRGRWTTIDLCEPCLQRAVARIPVRHGLLALAVMTDQRHMAYELLNALVTVTSTGAELDTAVFRDGHDPAVTGVTEDEFLTVLARYLNGRSRKLREAIRHIAWETRSGA